MLPSNKKRKFVSSSVRAHRLALAQASGQELRAWGSAKRQSAP